MKTKADLEEELAAARTRIAELEGMVSAYQFALQQLDRPQPIQPYNPPSPWYHFDTWPGLGSQPGQPVWSNTSAPGVYTLDTNPIE